jgi:predicted amidohydrolase YtcJ
LDNSLLLWYNIFVFEIIKTEMRNLFTVIVTLLSITNLNAQIADKVLKSGKVYIGNNTFTEAIAIKGSRIIYVGTDAGVAAHIDATTCVKDLAGKLVLPGIHDVHMHPLEASSGAAGTCVLSNTETNPENFISVLQACNLQPNSNGWKMASGHNITALMNAIREPRLILDDITTTEPLLVMERTSHSIWVNSKALQIAGITAATPNPVGGYIMRNAGGGPNGVLLDNAGDSLIQMALASNATIDLANKTGLINFGLPEMAKNGITSISEARTYYKRNYIPIWQQIKAENKLTVRVGLAPWIYPNDNVATQISNIQALYNAGDSLLKIRQIKVYSDGILSNTTACLHQPYISNPLNLPLPANANGLNYVNQTNLSTYITQLEPLGYDFHIHTIGDSGATAALNAIQAARITNGNIGARHRLTHIEMLKQSDYPRFAALNVTADAQVSGDFSNPSHWHENNPLIGAARADTLIAIKDLYNAGARITLSSDWDVSTLNPFVGMQNALTRAPQEMPNVNEVVKSYTINGAYVMRQEDVTGSLEVNKYADLIVVDQDIFTVPTNTIKNTKVLLTLLGGKQVYFQPTADLNCPEVLPISLISFSATKVEKNIKLIWKTTNEQNNKQFEIERSTDGIIFEKINTVISSGNLNVEKIYTYDDITVPPSAKIYYRLKQIDVDGKFTYSSIVMVNKKQITQVEITPNPANKEIRITGFTGKATVAIYKQTGQLIKTTAISNGNSINIEEFAKGLYFIKLIDTENIKPIQTGKFIKL